MVFLLNHKLNDYAAAARPRFHGVRRNLPRPKHGPGTPGRAALWRPGRVVAPAHRAEGVMYAAMLRESGGRVPRMVAAEDGLEETELQAMRQEANASSTPAVLVRASAGADVDGVPRRRR